MAAEERASSEGRRSIVVARGGAADIVVKAG
jgi:hypothetical protein